MKKRFTLIMMLLMIAIRANAAVLYDGSLNNGTDTPDEQGWEYITDPIFGNLASQTASSGMTTLDTTATTNIQAGYFSHNPVSGHTHPDLDGETFDRHSGYELNFSVRLNSESHSNSNRSGFSVIVLGDDLMGIELGFWTDEIWAQSGKPSDDELFIHSEGINFDTTLMINYNLSIFGDIYTLFSDTTPLLSGQLRNYSDWTNPIPSLGSFPYDSPNFLFFGDDTTSGKANVDIAHIELNTSSVPEPTGTLLFLIGLTNLLIFRRKKSV